MRKGRLQPGRMFLVDTAAGPHRRGRRDQGRARRRAALRRVAARRARSTSTDLPEREHIVHTHELGACAASRPSATPRRSCGSSLAPMARTGAEAIGSMGTDTPIAVLSERPRLLFDYFTQLFAQVTNPPLDAIREELVTSLGDAIGPERQPARRRRRRTAARSCCRSRSSTTTSWPRSCTSTPTATCPASRATKVRGLYRRRRRRRRRCAARLDEICAEVSAAIARGRALRRALRPRLRRRPRADPVAAAHLRGAPPPGARRRSAPRSALVVEAGDVREVHHVALLIGYGAAAVNPYLAMETVEDLVPPGRHRRRRAREGRRAT